MIRWLRFLPLVIGLAAGILPGSASASVPLQCGGDSNDLQRGLLALVDDGRAVHVRCPQLGEWSEAELKSVRQIAMLVDASFSIRIDSREALDRLQRTRLLERVVDVEMTCGRECLEALVATPMSGRVNRLLIAGPEPEELYECGVLDVADLAPLFRRPLPNLASLIVPSSDAAAKELAGSAVLENLEKLDICTNDVGLRAIVSSPHAGNLRTLIATSAASTPFDAKTARAVVESKALRDSLRQLTFLGSDSEAEKALTSDGFDAVVKHNRLRALRSFRIPWALHASSAQMLALFDAAWVTKLALLDVSGLYSLSYKSRSAQWQPLISRAQALLDAHRDLVLCMHWENMGLGPQHQCPD